MIKPRIPASIFNLNKSFCFVFLFFAYAFNLNAQDTITLISGNQIIGKVGDTTETDVSIEVIKNNKTKTTFVDYMDVYQISYGNGKKITKYYQDTLIGNDFSTEDMGLFLSGATDAKKYYKVPFAIKAGGFTAGILGGYFLPYYGMGLLAPGIYTGMMGAIEPKIKFSKLPDTKLKNNEVYLAGYKSIAAKKKMKTAVFTGLSGVIITAATLMIIN